MKIEKAYWASQTKDLSEFYFGLKDIVNVSLTERQIFVILMMSSVAQLIECDYLKKQIDNAINEQFLKDWIVVDVLAETDNLFFSNDEIIETIAAVKEVDEEKLIELFKSISQQMKYL